MTASKTNMSASVDNTGARRSTNRKNAIQFATVGLYVFPSDGKVPLIPRYNKADDSLSKDEIEKAREEFEGKSGSAPVHVGATRDVKTLQRMWRAFPDAVPSISCGPSKLVVLDADLKDDGPAKMAELFAEIGGVPEGVPVNPTKSGGQHFVFADPEGKFTNRAGLLKKQYGTDVRGNGGQFVGPGSIREDGAKYGTSEDKARFLRAVAMKTIPPLPEEIVALIGATTGEGVEGENVTPTQEREIIQRLRDADWEEHENAFDPVIGKFDLEGLLASNSEFRSLYNDPGADCSTNRFLAARHIMREWPDLPVEALSIFFSSWEGAGAYTDDKPKSGEYDDRQIAREWIKNQGLKKEHHSDGSAFDVVEIDEKSAFLANGGTEDRWQEWQQRLTNERNRRLVRNSEDQEEQPFDGHEVGHVIRRSKIAYIEDIRKAEPRHLDWCVKFFIARGTTSIVSGLWGAGKTAVFTDVALHVAHGLSYRNRKVTKAVVLYVALENAEDVERRVRAWCETIERAGHDVQNGAFVIHRGPCGLYRPDGKPTADEKELIRIAKEASEHYRLPVGMIIIDTLSQSIAPGNDREHGGVFVGAMQRISLATGANVTSLHHPTKAGEHVRGDGQLQGNVDTVIEVSRDKKTGRGLIEAGSKFRIGDPSKVRFGYRLRSVEIGRDEDGDIIDVVLATEDHDPSLAVDDVDTEEVPPIKVTDRREDRIDMFVAVMRREAERSAAEGEPLHDIAFTPLRVRHRRKLLWPDRRPHLNMPHPTQLV